MESSSGAFFGFNTTTFAERGLISGVYDSLAGIYDNIVQAYVEDVYTDVIEGYTIATIKVNAEFKAMNAPQISPSSVSWLVLLWKLLDLEGFCSELPERQQKRF